MTICNKTRWLAVAASSACRMLLLQLRLVSLLVYTQQLCHRSPKMWNMTHLRESLNNGLLGSQVGRSATTISPATILGWMEGRK